MMDSTGSPLFDVEQGREFVFHQENSVAFNLFSKLAAILNDQVYTAREI